MRENDADWFWRGRGPWGGGATGGARVRVARARGRLASLRGSRRPSRRDRTDRHPSHASVWRAIPFWIRAQS